MYAEGWIKTRNEEDTKRRRHETKKTRNEEDTKRKLHRVGANSYKTADDSSAMASSSIRSILALQVQFSHFKFNSRQVFLPINLFRAIRNTAVLRISFSEQTQLALSILEKATTSFLG